MAWRKHLGDTIRHFLYSGDASLREKIKSGKRVNDAPEQNISGVV
jgi:hypothetical protein